MGNSYRYLLPQEIQILLAILQALFRRGQFVFKKWLRFINLVCQHDVRLYMCEPTFSTEFLTTNSQPQIHLLCRFDVYLRIDRVVELKGGLKSIGIAVLSLHQPLSCAVSGEVPHLFKLQERNCLQCLLNVWYLLLQTRHPPLCVHLHELVLPSKRICQYYCRN